jgi:hypothetical protein
MVLNIQRSWHCPFYCVLTLTLLQARSRMEESKRSWQTKIGRFRLVDQTETDRSRDPAQQCHITVKMRLKSTLFTILAAGDLKQIFCQFSKNQFSIIQIIESGSRPRPSLQEPIIERNIPLNTKFYWRPSEREHTFLQMNSKLLAPFRLSLIWIPDLVEYGFNQN